VSASIKSVLVLTVICLVSALGLSWVNKKTKDKIKLEEEKFTLRSLRKALPKFDNSPDKDTVLIKAEGESYCIYRARQGGKIVGVAIPVVDPKGYSGNVKVLVGILPDGSISGVEVLSHAETPGLGARIEERKFREGLIWTCKDCKERRRRNLSNTKWKVKKDGGDIDEISGATISSRAMVRAVSKALRIYEKYKNEILNRRAEKCMER